MVTVPQSFTYPGAVWPQPINPPVPSVLSYTNAFPNRIINARNFALTTDALEANVINLTATFTMSCWLNLSAGGSGTQGAFYNGSGGSNGFGFFGIGGQIKTLYGGKSFLSSGVTASVGTWYNVLMTQGGGNWNIYINGVNENTDGIVPNAPTGNLFIGCDGSGNDLNGSVADCAIWSVVLTAPQIAAIATGGRANAIGANANLVGYWPIGGASPEPDLSGSANNATVTGTSITSGPPELSSYPTTGLAFPQHGGPAPTGSWAGPVTNLTHRWQMDSGSISGGVVHDLVGSLDATIVGSPTTVSSPMGAFASTALAFDGSTETLTLASAPIIMTGSPFTIAYWLYLPDINFAPDGADTDMRYFNFTDGSSAWVSANPTSAGVPGGLDFVNSVAGLEFYPTADTDLYSDGVWAHVAFTFNGTSTGVLYFNGSALATTAGPLTVDVGSLVANAIASRGDGLRHTEGSFYQFVTYSAVLSASEVAQLYQADRLFSRVQSFLYPGAVQPQVFPPPAAGGPFMIFYGQGLTIPLSGTAPITVTVT